MADEFLVSVLAPPNDHGGIGRYAKQLRTRTSVESDIEDIHILLYEEMGAEDYVRAAVRATRADVTHIHFEYGLFRPKLMYTWLFFPVLFTYAQLRRVPIVVTVHEVWTPETVGTIQYGYVWLVHALVVFVASQLVFMTKNAEDDFRPHRFADTNRIPHGVDVRAVRDVDAERARKTFGYNSNDYVISQIGYVSPRKGTDTFLDLAARHPERKFLVAGGPLREEDEAYFRHITDMAPENVYITGVLSDEAFHEAFVTTDVAILAYRDIRQSGILNWCFAYGVPVVCRAIDRFENLRDQGAPLVLFAEDGSYPSIDEALHIAFESGADMSAQMRAFGEDHNLSHVARQYADLYRSLGGNDTR